MKKIYSAQIIGGQMAEITEAEYSEDWNGDVTGYILNALDDGYELREGAESIPGNVQQNYGGMDPANIVTLYADGKAVEVWFAA